MRVDAAELRRIRELRVLSQRDLADLSGLTQATIWRLESGKGEAHPKTVRRLAEALGVEPQELLRRAEGDQETRKRGGVDI